MTFTAADPYTWRVAGKVVTLTAPIDREDGEFTVYLKGSRPDVRQGDMMTVTSVLRVVKHRACMVNGVIVPEWAEARVEE